MTSFELSRPLLDFIKNTQKLKEIEQELYDYGQLTENSVEARIDFII